MQLKRTEISHTNPTSGLKIKVTNVTSLLHIVFSYGEMVAILKVEQAKNMHFGMSFIHSSLAKNLVLPKT